MSRENELLQEGLVQCLEFTIHVSYCYPEDIYASASVNEWVREHVIRWHTSNKLFVFLQFNAFTDLVGSGMV